MDKKSDILSVFPEYNLIPGEIYSWDEFLNNIAKNTIWESIDAPTNWSRYIYVGDSTYFDIGNKDVAINDSCWLQQPSSPKTEYTSLGISHVNNNRFRYIGTFPFPKNADIINEFPEYNLVPRKVYSFDEFVNNLVANTFWKVLDNVQIGAYAYLYIGSTETTTETDYEPGIGIKDSFWCKDIHDVTQKEMNKHTAVISRNRHSKFQYIGLVFPKQAMLTFSYSDYDRPTFETGDKYVDNKRFSSPLAVEIITFGQYTDIVNNYPQYIKNSKTFDHSLPLLLKSNKNPFVVIYKRINGTPIVYVEQVSSFLANFIKIPQEQKKADIIDHMNDPLLPNGLKIGDIFVEYDDENNEYDRFEVVKVDTKTNILEEYKEYNIFDNSSGNFDGLAPHDYALVLRCISDFGHDHEYCFSATYDLEDSIFKKEAFVHKTADILEVMSQPPQPLHPWKLGTKVRVLSKTISGDMYDWEKHFKNTNGIGYITFVNIGNKGRLYYQVYSDYNSGNFGYTYLPQDLEFIEPPANTITGSKASINIGNDNGISMSMRKMSVGNRISGEIEAYGDILEHFENDPRNQYTVGTKLRLIANPSITATILENNKTLGEYREEQSIHPSPNTLFSIYAQRETNEYMLAVLLEIRSHILGKQNVIYTLEEMLSMYELSKKVTADIIEYMNNPILPNGLAIGNIIKLFGCPDRRLIEVAQKKDIIKRYPPQQLNNSSHNFDNADLGEYVIVCQYVDSGRYESPYVFHALKDLDGSIFIKKADIIPTDSLIHIRSKYVARDKNNIDTEDVVIPIATGTYSEIVEAFNNLLVETGNNLIFTPLRSIQHTDNPDDTVLAMWIVVGIDTHNDISKWYGQCFVDTEEYFVNHYELANNKTADIINHFNDVFLNDLHIGDVVTTKKDYGNVGKIIDFDTKQNIIKKYDVLLKEDTSGNFDRATPNTFCVVIKNWHSPRYFFLKLTDLSDWKKTEPISPMVDPNDYSIKSRNYPKTADIIEHMKEPLLPNGLKIGDVLRYKNEAEYIVTIIAVGTKKDLTLEYNLSPDAYTPHSNKLADDAMCILADDLNDGDEIGTSHVLLSIEDLNHYEPVIILK